jgi:hypothetical protein
MPVYFDGMCFICIVVDYGQTCSESIQCKDDQRTECVGNTCKCRSGLTHNGKRCVGIIGMYKEYIGMY